MNNTLTIPDMYGMKEELGKYVPPASTPQIPKFVSNMPYVEFVSVLNSLGLALTFLAEAGDYLLNGFNEIDIF